MNDSKKYPQNKFILTLSQNVSQCLLEKVESALENKWKAIKEAMTSKCKVLDQNYHQHEEVISLNTLRKIRETKKQNTSVNIGWSRTEEVKTQVKYSKTNTVVMKNIGTDKQKYVKDLTVTADTSLNKFQNLTSAVMYTFHCLLRISYIT